MAVTNSKILIIDVETAPKLAYVWGLWDNNVSLSQLVSDTYLLCWAGSWLDEECIYYDSLHYHPRRWKKDPENDIEILKSAWKMLDEADYVIAHNVKFDVGTLNSRFIQQGMGPPSSYKLIDTLRIAKQNFKFTSNKLEFITSVLTKDSKMDAGGFETWRAICSDKCEKAFDKMVEYNIKDIEILEEVYLKLRAWDKKHASLPVSGDLTEMACNVCGSRKIRKNGTYNTNTQRYQRYQCGDCGHSMRGSKAIKKTKEQRANLLRSI